ELAARRAPERDRSAQVAQPERRVDREAGLGAHGCVAGRAELELVPGLDDVAAGDPEDLAGDRQVEGESALVDDGGDARHWPKSSDSRLRDDADARHGTVVRSAVVLPVAAFAASSAGAVGPGKLPGVPAFRTSAAAGPFWPTATLAG